MFQPDAKDVPGRIDIAIMRRPAVRAFPAPYSKICDTSRPRRGHRAARRADLGTPAFVNIDIHRLPSGSFVSQHVSEARPGSVKDGLCHPCLRQRRGAYVANRYQLVLPSDPRGLLVKVVAAGVRNLGMDRPNSLLVTGALGNCQLRLIVPVVAQGRDSLPLARDGQFFQAQVDPDPTIAGGQIILDLALESGMPSTARVLNECASLEQSAYLPTFPEAIAPLEVDRRIAVNFGRSGNVGYPAKRTLIAKAGPKTRAAAILIAGFGELPTDGLNGIGVQAKIGGAPRRQINQVERRRPTALKSASASPLRFALRSHAEIPHLIAGRRKPREAAVATFDPKLVGQYRHSKTLAFLREIANHRNSPHPKGPNQ